MTGYCLMREIARETGVACLMVTHDDRLARAADRILRIEDGLVREIVTFDGRLLEHFDLPATL